MWKRYVREKEAAIASWECKNTFLKKKKKKLPTLKLFDTRSIRTYIEILLEECLFYFFPSAFNDKFLFSIKIIANTIFCTNWMKKFTILAKMFVIVHINLVTCKHFFRNVWKPLATPSFFSFLPPSILIITTCNRVWEYQIIPNKITIVSFSGH